MLRRRLKQEGSNENDSLGIDYDPLNRLSTRSKSKKCFYQFCVIIFLTDLILTITRQTYPFSDSTLPLIQRLVYTPGRDGTYAQNYQDTWIVKLTKANANFDTSTSNQLFFLDIGAYHGLWCSNSYLLEKQYKWEGACVEPFPDGFNQRSCQLFVNAMSDRDGVVVNFSGMGQERSIGAADTPEVLKASVRKEGLVAETISFPTLLKQSKAPSFIAFISLDVEGHEYTVLTKFPWDEYRVGAWIVEGNDDKVKAILEQHGYRRRPVQNSGVDEYFVAEEYWKDMAQKEYREHPLFSWGC